MDTTKAKTLLSKNKYPEGWFGCDYTMNLYRGCHHGCIYCDSRSECYHNDKFDCVVMKENAIELLRNELSRKKKKGVIGIGAMSDTYNRFEEKYELTRQALQMIQQYHFGVSIETKSDLVVRDIDVLQEIQKHHDVIVKITITTVDDQLSKIIEPGVCPSSQRFLALKEMSRAGLFTGVLLHPVLPFLTDSPQNIENIVKLAYENGAQFIHCYFGVTLRDRQRDYYYQQLDKSFPHLKEKYQRIYHNSYQCLSPHYQQLKYVFEQACQKYGLLYRMEDIIQAYRLHKNQNVEQLSLF